MAEPVSQVVASMPRGRFLALLALFLGPAVAVYTLFSIYPLIATMGLSTYTTDSGGAYHFVGLTNIVTLLTDAIWSKPFWNAAKNNLIFFIVHMLVQNPIGIVLAGLLSLPGLKLKGLYRTLIFLPTMLSVVIVGFAWSLILSPLWGVAEGALKAVGLGSLFAPWLGLPSTALVTLALISVWQFVGIPLMLIYAALLNIPDELVDAARVDGITDMLAPRNGTVNPDGSAGRTILPGYQKDVIQWWKAFSSANNPVALFSNLEDIGKAKFNPFVNAAAGLGNQSRGTWMGTPIETSYRGAGGHSIQTGIFPNSNYSANTPLATPPFWTSYLDYLAEQVAPINVETAASSKLSPAETALGFRTPSSFVNDPEAYQGSQEAKTKREESEGLGYARYENKQLANPDTTIPMAREKAAVSPRTGGRKLGEGRS